MRYIWWKPDTDELGRIVGYAAFVPYWTDNGEPLTDDEIARFLSHTWIS